MKLPISHLEALPQWGRAMDEQAFQARLRESPLPKIVILDDDPTGIQTVHDLSVFMDWSRDSISQGFQEDAPGFFISTNSRSFSREQTARAHREIAQNLAAVSAQAGQDFVLISRSDSTMRGHYPLEIEVLRATLEAESPRRFDAEFMIPCFLEGGRFTCQDIHYVQDGDWLIPAGESEFAKDKTFGFSSSHLGAYIQEKTGGSVKREACVSLGLDDLAPSNLPALFARLIALEHYQHVVVNGVSYLDLQCFTLACAQAIGAGKQFLFRTAASFVKTITGNPSRAYLTRKDLRAHGAAARGGLVIVGSHVQKTTQQVEAVKQAELDCALITFDQHRVLEKNGLASESRRVAALAEAAIQSGKTAIVQTRRDRFDLPNGTPEQQLAISVEISNALSAVVAQLSAQPGFLIAKGGITSSDIGKKALGIRKGRVMGQVAPGVPVLLTGPESRFPGLPYIIFPGNVGDANTLLHVLQAIS